jgi:hypothetical protein
VMHKIVNRLSAPSATSTMSDSTFQPAARLS